MSVKIRPVSETRPDFAGVVTGVDIAAGVSDDVAAAIEAGMDRYGVLVFRGQEIDDHQQHAFSCHFGPIEKATGDLAQGEQRRLSTDINDVSNLDKHGDVLPMSDRRRQFKLGNRLWHSDSSFKPTPAKYSLLSARVIPDAGGNTEFADMRAAWDTLSTDVQARLMHMVCEHSQIHSRAKLGFTDWTEDELEKNRPVRQRMVRRHPSTGRLSIYLSAHIGAIEGLPVPDARILVLDLVEHSTQRRFVYAHEWRQWDLVMWDNRVTMHRATEFDPTRARDMRRTTVSDRAPTLEQPL